MTRADLGDTNSVGSRAEPENEGGECVGAVDDGST